jgi:hypothetical protein
MREKLMKDAVESLFITAIVNEEFGIIIII